MFVHCTVKAGHAFIFVFLLNVLSVVIMPPSGHWCEMEKLAAPAFEAAQPIQVGFT